MPEASIEEALRILTVVEQERLTNYIFGTKKLQPPHEITSDLLPGAAVARTCHLELI
jgi:hypothetical protein